MNNNIPSIVFASFLALTGVDAEAEAQLYCISGAPTDGVSVDDVTFGTGATGVNASDCYGEVSDNGPDGQVPAANDTLADINALKWDGALGNLNDWLFVSKVGNTGTETDGNDLGGIDFTLSVSGSAEPIHYVLTWVDNNLAWSPNLPFIADLVIVAKQSSAAAGGGWAAFLFNDVTFVQETSPPPGGNGGGTFNIEFAPQPGYSHISAYVRLEQGIVCCQEQQVPEPGTLALLGLGTVGLAAIRRRRR